MTNIDEIVQKYFKLYYPNLGSDHFNLIKGHTIEIINTIVNAFNIEDQEGFEHELKQNNGRNVKVIINMILPFITDADNQTQHITSLEQIFNKTDKEGIFTYSNRQYDMYDIDTEKKYEFNEQYIDDHVELIKHSIRICSNKLYPNLITVIPVVDFKNSIIYKNTEQDIQKFSIIENFYQNGLYLGDVYSSIVTYLYQNVLSVKWFLYEKLINGKPKLIIR